VAYAITVDTGGTFSDLVLADDERVIGLYKADTTPGDVFAGVANALALAAADVGVALAELLGRTSSFVYSTTHATNAILEGRTARTAFLTTEGHPDILLYREGGKDQPLNIAMPYPKPYVPRSLTFELKERVLADGSVLQPLDEAHLLRVIARLAELEVEAVGVCLLWSVVNPSHEARVGELLAAHLPQVEVTLGHRINRISREYRRASSTVIDASLKRLMRSHLTDVDARLRALGFSGEPLMVTHLSGGVQRLDEACEYPLHAVDSGPALAPVSGLTYAAVEPDLGRRDLIVVDAGGTSCDVAPTRAGRVVYTREKWLGQRFKGHMTGLPAVDTRSVGAGGGSIASVDAGGLLHVGPGSAGAVPGPACYGRGGDRPTVTDAAIVLGYIDPAFFLGGRVTLRDDLARAALARDVATPLGLSVEAAADAVMALYSEHLRAFIADITIAQGLDPREALLVAGGGSAGLNIVMVARELGVPQVLVPSLAAGLSAVGGHYSDIVATFTRGLMTSTSAFDFARVNTALDEIAQEGDTFLARIDDAGETSRELFCEARYRNQLWEIDLPLGDLRRFDGGGAVTTLQDEFDALHEAVFAVRQPGEPVEVLAWRGDVRVHRPRPALPTRAERAAIGGAATSRQIYFGRTAVDARVWRAADLGLGDAIEGPAIIEEPTTTIVIPPGARATVRPSHYLIDVGGEHVG
jgi:N-methylhydantoinase A